MCGGGAPQDNSDKVAQIEADRAREAAAELARTRAADEARFNTNLNSAYTSAIGDAESYFTSMGLDPAQYGDAISRGATQRRGTVPQLDSAPGSYFAGLGQSVFNSEQDSLRNRSTRAVNSFSQDGFDRNRIADTADDPFIASLLEEQFLDSQRRLEGQVARGTLTNFGLQQSMRDLQRQRSGANNNLSALSGAILETGRGNLRNIASSGRTAASGLNLGQSFDPFSFEREINDSTSSFMTGLNDRIRGAAPIDLFDLGAAFQFGGQRQGAQSTGFDPDASAGILSFFVDDEEKKKKKSQVENAF